MSRPTSAGPDSTLVIVIVKVAVVLAVGAGGVYWFKTKPSPAGTIASADARAGIPVLTSNPPATAARQGITAPPATRPPAAAEPTPTALERVMAAAAKSKRADALPEATDNAPATLTAAGLEDVIGRAMPAVVRVETSSGFGSGFFISADTLLTNVHVVGGNSMVTVRRPDGKTVVAHVERTASELDIAVIRISNADPSQPILPLGSGSRARAGQEVVALGSPLGLQNTVTRGIVSAVRGVGGLTLVQTDAAINPGTAADRCSIAGVRSSGSRQWG